MSGAGSGLLEAEVETEEAILGEALVSFLALNFLDLDFLGGSVGKCVVGGLVSFISLLGK